MKDFHAQKKQKLYELLDQYLSGSIEAWTFCSELNSTYVHEINDSMLTDLEQDAFSNLEKVSSRFTKFEEDLINYPGVYFNESELREVAIDTWHKLLNSQ